MKLATFVWALLLLVVGSRCVDFLERILSPDLVALSFDKSFPAWRDSYRRSDTLGEFEVFEKIAKP